MTSPAEELRALLDDWHSPEETPTLTLWLVDRAEAIYELIDAAEGVANHGGKLLIHREDPNPVPRLRAALDRLRQEAKP